MENTNGKKVGLVLEGGAMRGMYTAGILDTFLKLGVKADIAVGVSAGALFGVNYVSGQAGRVIRYNKKYNSDKNYMGPRPLLREGNIISTDYAYRRVPHELDPFDDETYKKSPVEFYAVITNVETGLPEYVKITSVFDQMDTLRASGSMPLVSKPVKIGDSSYLDGALGDSIPYEWMMNQGTDKTIVILTQDINYVKKPANKFLANLFYKRKLPAVAKAFIHRHEKYNSQTEALKKLESEGKAFVFRPSEPIKISKTERNPENLQYVYDLGVKDATARYKELCEYLEN